ncbi:anti-sigma factor family protein [Streptomyces sp. NPDC054796]
MTSAPFASGASGTDEHPEVAEISALTEGLLPPDRSTHVQAHLVDCELCADVRASLHEIRDALGTLPGPVRMPADVAGRIDAALAAEALLDSTPPSPSPSLNSAVSRETETGTGTETRTEPGTPVSVSRETSDATDAPHARETADRHPVSAATGRSADRPAGHSGGSTGPGRRDGSRGPQRRRRWRTTLVAAVGVVGVLGIGGLVVQSLDSSGQGASSASNEGSTDARTTAGAEDQALKQHVQTLLAEKSPAAESAPEIDTKQSPATPDTGDSPMTGTSVTVPSCVREGIARVRDADASTSETPLAVDEDARYKKATGYLVVLPHAGGDVRKVDAYLVDASCVSGEATGPGEVLVQRTYPKS